MFLPLRIDRVRRPPLKCQGIKTRLVPFIARSVEWRGDGRWIEPFLGSGAVLFNLAPERALAVDTNRHIIGLYRNIQSGALGVDRIRGGLEEMGARLEHGGRRYYEQMRAEFNRTGARGETRGDGTAAVREPAESSLLFLFLNRCCFNGLMRFNGRGEFNVPFGHKPRRFSPAFVTRIVNQVAWVLERMRGRDWRFEAVDWRRALEAAGRGDFVYADPPYVGRHSGYFNRWSETEAELLARRIRALPCGFAVSMWKENAYRRNAHIDHAWGGLPLRTADHFYHVGSREELRHPMTEALVIRSEFLAG